MARPYFIWDYDFSEEKVWEILQGDNEYYKTWLVGRILQYARWDDIWKYLTLDDVRACFDRIAWRFPFIKEMWAYALEVWDQDAKTTMLRERPIAYTTIPDREPQLIEGILTPLQLDESGDVFRQSGRATVLVDRRYGFGRFLPGPPAQRRSGSLHPGSDVARSRPPRYARHRHGSLKCDRDQRYRYALPINSSSSRQPDLPPLKLDLVRDFGPQFGQRRAVGGVIVDSLTNIAVNKVTAIFGRTEAKDFVDLYCLLRAGYDLKALIELAKEKDLGLSEFYLGYAMRQAARFEALPRMFDLISLEELRALLPEVGRRPVAAGQPRHANFPSSTVISTCVSIISIGSTSKIFCPSTTRSAILPGVMLPR